MCLGVWPILFKSRLLKRLPHPSRVLGGRACPEQRSGPKGWALARSTPLICSRLRAKSGVILSVGVFQPERRISRTKRLSMCWAPALAFRARASSSAVQRLGRPAAHERGAPCLASFARHGKARRGEENREHTKRSPDLSTNRTCKTCRPSVGFSDSS